MKKQTFEDWMVGKEEIQIKKILFADDSNSDYIRKLKNILNDIITNELTITQKECIKLYYFDGFTLNDIAKKRGTSLTAVSACKRRAEDRIMRILKYFILEV